MTIGEKLIAYRGETPQSEVANAVGVSVSALSMYENDQRIPRDGVKIKLAKYYKTTVESLFFDTHVHLK